MTATNEDRQRETYQAAERALRSRDPREAAVRAGITWKPGVRGEGELRLPALSVVLTLSWPQLEFSGPTPILLSFPFRLIALHCLADSPGAPPGRSWVGYRDLPGGMFYSDVVHREVEAPLADLYRTSPGAFKAAGDAGGGSTFDLADASILFRPLPYVPIVFALWTADDEFPAEVKVLYERTGAQNLPLLDLRLLADLLGSLLRRGAPARPGLPR